MKTNLTILIPAYNEEKNIAATIQNVTQVMKDEGGAYEILVIDDGSTDSTGTIADQLAKKDSHLRVIHHPLNQGFGSTIIDGIAQARKTYLTGMPGDNDTDPDLLRQFVRQLGTADVLIGVMTDNKKRSLPRRILSGGFIWLMNRLFGLNLIYYNGYLAAKTALLRSVPIRSKGFAIFAEIKVRLLTRGASHKEIPFTHIGRQHGASKAVSWKSFFQTVRTIGILVWDRYLITKDRVSGL